MVAAVADAVVEPSRSWRRGSPRRRAARRSRSRRRAGGGSAATTRCRRRAPRARSPTDVDAGARGSEQPPARAAEHGCRERAAAAGARRSGAAGRAGRIARGVARSARACAGTRTRAAEPRRCRATIGERRCRASASRAGATAGCGARERLLDDRLVPALVGDDERGGEVDEDSRAAEQREHDEPDAVEHRVDVEVAAEAAADAGDHPVGAAPAQLLVCERVLSCLQRAAAAPASIRQVPGPTLQSPLVWQRS